MNEVWKNNANSRSTEGVLLPGRSGGNGLTLVEEQTALTSFGVLTVATRPALARTSGAGPSQKTTDKK